MLPGLEPGKGNEIAACVSGCCESDTFFPPKASQNSNNAAIERLNPLKLLGSETVTSTETRNSWRAQSANLRLCVRQR